MLPAAYARRADARCRLHVRDRLHLGARASRPERSDGGGPGRNERRGRPQLRPRGAVDHAEGQQAGVRHERDPAVARHGRPLLVLVPDPRRTTLLLRRSGEEGQDAALRPREDGGRADDDYAHSLRCAEPSVQHRPLRQEGHRLRVQLPGAGHRGNPLDQAARDDDRADPAGRDQGRRRRCRPRHERRKSGCPAAADGARADRAAGRPWRTRRRPGRRAGAAAQQDAVLRVPTSPPRG